MFRPSRWSLGAAALAFALTAPPARAAEVDKLLPADSEAAVYLNVRQVLESALVKKFAFEQIKQALAGEDAQKELKALGLDPLKDIDRVVIGAYGDDPQKPNFLVIIHGRFDADKLFLAAEAASKKDGEKLTIIKEGNNTLIKIQPKDNPNPIYATLVDGKRVVFGSSKELVNGAVAAAATNKAKVKPALAALITGIDEKAAVSVVAVVSGKIGNLPLPGVADPNVAKNLEKMENIFVTLRVTGDVSIDVSLGMKNADAADDFGKLVDQGLNQAKAFLPALLAGDPKTRPLGELAKSLTSSTKDQYVTISAKLSGDAIAKMLNPGE